MGLFDNNKKNKHINSLNIQEIENEIIDKKQEINKAKKAISVTRTEIDKENKQHEKQLKALDETQVSFKEQISTEAEKLNEELVKLEKKQARYKKSHEVREEEIVKKINELKAKKKKLVDQKLDLDKTYFEKRKKTIENKLAEFKGIKKKQDEDYEKKMSLMKENYEKLVEQKKNNFDSIEAAKKELKAVADEEIAKLQEKENAIKNKQQDTLKKLAEEHAEEIAAVKDKQETSIRAKREELNALYVEAESLTNLRNNLAQELDTTRLRNDKEYDTIYARYEAENAKLNKDNDILNNELASKQRKLDEQVKNEKNEYESKLAELNYLASILDDKKNVTSDDLLQKANAKDEELKARYSKYLNTLDDEYQTEKTKLDEQLNALKYNLSQEEERLKNRNEFLNERYKSRDAQYKKTIEDYNAQLSKAENSLTELENEYHNRIVNFKKDIEKLKNDNALALEEQIKHYSLILSTTKKDFSIRRKDINESISLTKKNIENINLDIEKLRTDLQEYKEKYEKKKISLDKEHESYLNKVANKKANIEKNIASLNAVMKEKYGKHATNLSELEAKRLEIVTASENNLNSLNEDFVKKVETLNSSHEKAMTGATIKHNELIESINANYVKNVENANKAYADKQKEYEDEKIKLEIDLNNLQETTENKINQLQVQKSEILQIIANLKVEIDAKQAEYDAQVKQIENEHIAKLDEMARIQDEALAKITLDYENIPNRELSVVRADYEAKQKEYNDNAADVSLKKQSIDNEYKTVENAMKHEKDKVDDEFAITNREYERAKADAEKLESDLNSELAKRKQELEDYKDDLAKQLEHAKQEKEAEIEKASIQLENEYASVKEQYENKQAALARQYDEEIRIHQNDLDAKYENLYSLINEINQRRDNTEKEYIAKYNVVADATKEVQKELDELVNANNLKRSELATSLEQIKADNEAEIVTIKNNYDNVLSEKKKAYEEYIAEVRETCNNLKKEISNAEKQKEIESSKLEAYVNEKLTAMDSLEKETAIYVQNVKDKMEALASQHVSLEEAHNKRVATIKSQIASTMSDYDNLLRNKSNLVKATGKEEELTDKAIAFRDRIKALDDAHKEMVADLLNKRNETLDNITKEIELLEANKPARLKSYEDEITNISLTYDAMLRDEQTKQEQIEELIKKSKDDQENILKDNDEAIEKLAEELLIKKQQLANKSEEDLADAGEEFGALTLNLKEEFDKLVNVKKDTDKQIVDYAAKYEKIDSQIYAATNELKDKYITELLRVRKSLEQQRIKNQKEIDALDAMKSKADSIFKKF